MNAGSRDAGCDAELRSRVMADFPRVQTLLEKLVAIPSISASGHPAEQVRASAELVVRLLRAEGASEARLLELPGAHPAAYARFDGERHAPTVLLYAHHDVQPPGDAQEWATDPFRAMVRDGRMYGRGASDDKAGIVMHLATLAAFDGLPPVNVVVFVEGEEEAGSEHVAEYLKEYADLLSADVVVVADAGNWRVGVPTLTTSLRGLVSCVVEVRTARSAQHSGSLGGVLPDALSALAHVLSSLHSVTGKVAVEGLVRRSGADLDLSEDEVRELAQPVSGLRLEGPFTERLWFQPAISVLAVDAPRIAEAINQIVPVARAKVSLRIPPGQDVEDARRALVDHLTAAAPWGAEITVDHFETGAPFELKADGPASEVWREAMSRAWQRPVVEMGEGGSIPIVAALQASFPKAEILLVGPGDPTSAIHAPNESQHLGDLAESIVAESIALTILAERWRDHG